VRRLIPNGKPYSKKRGWRNKTDKLTLRDIGTVISQDKGWTELQVMYGNKWKIQREIVIIMMIRAPNGSVLAITDYGKATRNKCKVIKEFMRRNRNNGI